MILPRGFIYYASGASALGDLRGFARIGHPIGVSLPDLSDASLAELLSRADTSLDVFVDTGAFSEVEPGPGGKLVVVRAIDDAGWRERLDVGLQIARAFGAKALLVAPDRVGDQAETLERLRRYAGEVREIVATGARIVVPIQRGAMLAEDFDAAACLALGFSNFVRGIPGNKVAMPALELQRFLRAVRPSAVHILGMGPRSDRLPVLLDVIGREVPDATLSSDSNPIQALVGRHNGRGYGLPRPPGSTARVLTAWQDETGSRESAIVLTFGPSFMFAKMREAMADRGVIVRGFERVDDGIQLTGFDVEQGAEPQMWLFEEKGTSR